MTDYKIRVVVEGEDRGATKVLEGAGRSLKDFGSSMVGLGGKLTAGITAPLLGLGGGALKIASDFEQVQVAFNTMLGDAGKAQTLFNDIKEFSASTPFEFPEVVEAGRKLLAFGVGAEDITATMRRLGDVAAGVGAPLREVAEIYGKARVQGRLFAEDINQLTGRGIPILGALAQVMGVNESAIKKMVEEGKVGFPELEAAFKTMTDQGGQFSGLMQAQSQTLGGLFFHTQRYRYVHAGRHRKNHRGHV
jgi:tape measure domain-containing protein